MRNVHVGENLGAWNVAALHIDSVVLFGFFVFLFFGSSKMQLLCDLREDFNRFSKRLPVFIILKIKLATPFEPLLQSSCPFSSAALPS